MLYYLVRPVICLRAIKYSLCLIDRLPLITLLRVIAFDDHWSNRGQRLHKGIAVCNKSAMYYNSQRWSQLFMCNSLAVSDLPWSQVIEELSLHVMAIVVSSLVTTTMWHLIKDCNVCWSQSTSIGCRMSRYPMTIVVVVNQCITACGRDNII